MTGSTFLTRKQDDLSPAAEPSRRRKLRGAGIAVGLAAVLVTGTVLIVNGSRSEPAEAGPLPSTTFDVDPEALPPILSEDATIPPKDAQSIRGADCELPLRPARLLIPSLCMNGAVVPTTLQPDGALAVPYDVQQVAVWSDGAGLTSGKTGTTLLAGHVNYAGQGRGTLYRLASVVPGTVVLTVDNRRHVTRWRVVSLQVVQKKKLPSNLFVGTDGPRRLAIVTCGGPLQRIPGYGNAYRDNVIATAIPA